MQKYLGTSKFEWHKMETVLEKQKGIIKGKKQGRENAKREIAKKMLEMQMNVQDISTITGLSEEKIKKMQEEM